MSGNPESPSEEEIQGVIELNTRIMRERRQELKADVDKIQHFLSGLSVHDGIPDHRRRIIRKATHILAGLAWHQYFHEGNKETATRIALYYLKKNGFELPLESLKEQEELYRLLVVVLPHMVDILAS